MFFFALPARVPLSKALWQNGGMNLMEKPERLKPETGAIELYVRRTSSGLRPPSPHPMRRRNIRVHPCLSVVDTGLFRQCIGVHS
jgi:hypothetical protein